MSVKMSNSVMNEKDKEKVVFQERINARETRDQRVSGCSNVELFVEMAVVFCKQLPT